MTDIPDEADRLAALHPAKHMRSDPTPIPWQPEHAVPRMRKPPPCEEMDVPSSDCVWRVETLPDGTVVSELIQNRPWRTIWRMAADGRWIGDVVLSDTGEPASADYAVIGTVIATRLRRPR